MFSGGEGVHNNTNFTVDTKEPITNYLKKFCDLFKLSNPEKYYLTLEESDDELKESLYDEGILEDNCTLKVNKYKNIYIHSDDIAGFWIKLHQSDKLEHTSAQIARKMCCNLNEIKIIDYESIKNAPLKDQDKIKVQWETDYYKNPQNY
jgi:single-stranded DNA-specific DHH superfamily exonuclease